MHSTLLRAAVCAALAFGAGAAHAQTVVGNVGGRLTLTTPGGDQTVRVEIGRGGTVRVSGFPGLADGATYSGISGLAVITGAGNDSVEVEAATDQGFDLRLDTGAGAAEQKIKWTVLPATGTTALNLDLGALPGGGQKASVEVESSTGSAAIAITSTLGEEFAARIGSSLPSELLRASVTNGARKSRVELVSSASALEFTARGSHVALDNEVKVGVVQLRPADVALNWGVQTGNGDDKIEATVVAPGSRVTQAGLVRSFAGNDFLKFETEGAATVSGLVLNGGDGNDEIAQLFKGPLQLSQTLGTQLFGAAGDDRLTLATDTAIRGTGLPNDLIPLVNCGAGVDGFSAFGRIVGCESRF